MTEPKRPLKVFLCHAHADRDAVRALYTRLTDDGVDAWLDKEKLLPGQDWELEIKKAVREADVVVVCLSKQFNQAGFRQKEVRLALDTAMEKIEDEIFIIPARLEECKVPESLRKWHWVDLFEAGGYDKLMLALRIRVERVEATTREMKDWHPEYSDPTGTVQIDVGSDKSTPVDFLTSDNAKTKVRISKKTIWAAGIILAVILLSTFLLSSLLDYPITRLNLTETAIANTLVLVTTSETQEAGEILTTATKTNTPTATFTPSITPTFTVTATQTPSGFVLISISEIAYRGGTADAEIKTQPGTACALGYILPTGKLSDAAGTGPDTADENGICSWTWTISRFTTPGWGNIYIEAGGKDETYPIEIK
jgi:hypothetical protein